MESEVFGSWIIWFHNVCWAEHFPSLWTDVRHHYVPSLRRVLDKGTALREVYENEPNGQAASLAAFFEFMTSEFDCPIIAGWLKED